MATLRELVTGRGYDASQGIIDEVSNYVPEVRLLDSILIPGTTFQSVSQISDPTTGFRTVGNGIDASDEGYALRDFALGILAGLCQRDKAAVDADIRCRERTRRAADLALVRAGMKTLGGKVWYGAKAGDEKFNGCAALCKDALVVNAGGSTASQMASVYALGFGEEKCHLVFNENAPLLTQNELQWKEGVMTGANNKPVPSYWTDLTGWAGFACRNANSVARIANLDASTHKLTDSILAELVSAYSEANDGLMPDALFMTFKQRLYLQQSRGTTVRTGARSSIENTAAIPTDYEGIPIVATPNLVNTEAVWVAAA